MSRFKVEMTVETNLNVKDPAKVAALLRRVIENGAYYTVPAIEVAVADEQGG